LYFSAKLKIRVSLALPYQITPLSETAVLLLFAHKMDGAVSEQVTGLHCYWQRFPFNGLVETVPGYHSLAIFTDAWRLRQQGLTVMDTVRQQTALALTAMEKGKVAEPTAVKTIAVQYGGEFGPDIEAVARRNGISVHEVVALHTAATYRVFMMGFQPGFAYMGITDEKIFAERKEKPVPVAAGSVGLAGRQTGVYPKASPGGWQVIGHTDLAMFDANRDNPFYLQAGDRVRFVAV
jgi:inhibitor of KinA